MNSSRLKMFSFTFLTLKTVLPVLYLFAILNGTCSEKVDPENTTRFRREASSSVIVECSRPQETSTVVAGLLKEISEQSRNPAATRAFPLTQLVKTLQDIVVKFLKPVIQLLKNLKILYNILWPSFEVHIPSATPSLISKLLKISIVIKVRPERNIPLIPPQPPESESPPQGNQTWNIGLIDARCKNITCLGQNVTIGVIDTGVRASHIEVKDNWIGSDKNSSYYGFLDTFNKTCEPYDDSGHGTHVTSTACGKNVGVAPKSKWLMCRACNETTCPEAGLKICMTWIACPWKCGDTSDSKTTKNCTFSPQVINNSWGGSASGVTDDEYYAYYDYVKYWISLGIVPVFSAGNSGTGCNTIGIPGAYDIVIDVGAIDAKTSLAYFSSVGPAISTRPLTNESIAVGTCSANKCGNSNPTCALIKPTVVAPGVNITAAYNISDKAYISLNGTSMAAPHVTGVIALMICSNPNVKWNHTVAYEILRSTTNTSRIDLLGERQNKGSPLVRTNLACNVMLSIICNTYPNNMYGYGVANACKAVTASKKLKQ